MSRDIHYDAFISYRHLEMDEYIANQLQSLLESYHPPRGVENARRIERVFLDHSELPTSRDLGGSLQNALQASDFLIVILSEQTKESKWCMEEIRSFKKAHGGKLDRILPVLVSGDPGQALPEELLFEETVLQSTDGETVVIRKEIEPICCDVRGENNAARRKKLKTEFLRIVASLLGCSYDDLFQRHKRRERKRLVRGLSVVLGILLAVIAVLIYSYIKVRNSEQEYRSNLMDSYVASGNERAADGKMQEALAYYVKVLSEMPEHEGAKRGALLTLQRYDWIYEEGIQTSPSFSDVEPSYEIEQKGTTVTLHWNSGGEWMFELPEKFSSAFDQSILERDQLLVAARDHADICRIVVSYHGFVYFFDSQQNSDDSMEPHQFRLYAQSDYAKYLLEQYDAGRTNAAGLWISPKSDTAALYILGESLLFFDTDTGEILSSRGGDSFPERILDQLIISPDGQSFACAAHGPDAQYRPLLEIDVGRVSDFGGYGTVTNPHYEDHDKFINLSYITDTKDLLWTLIDKLIVLSDYQDQDFFERAEVSLNQKTTNASVTSEGHILISNESEEVQEYRIVRFRSEYVEPEEETEEKPKQFCISEDNMHLQLLDDSGSVTQEVSLENRTGNVYTLEYDKTTGTVYCIPLYIESGSDWEILRFGFSEDTNNLIPLKEIDLKSTSHFAIHDYVVFPGGIAVLLNGSHVQFFRTDDDTPYRTIYPEKTSSNQPIFGIDVFEDGELLMFSLLESDFIEMWDVEKNQCIAAFNSRYDAIGSPEEGAVRIHSNFSSTGNCLRMNAPDPDGKAVKMLNNLCCYTLNDDLSLSVKDAVFDGEMGNWQSVFRISYPYE